MIVRILIISGYGYIGSKVHNHLKCNLPNSKIDVVDQVEALNRMTPSDGPTNWALVNWAFAFIS